MKFAKELDENAIPEWKDRYFDYKGAKKKLKAIARALRTVDRSSPLSLRKSPFGNSTSVRDAPVYSFLNRGRPQHAVGGQDDNVQHPLRTRDDAPSPLWQGMDGQTSTHDALSGPVTNERSPLRTRSGGNGAPKLVRYGSIIGSPASSNSPTLDLTPQRTQASLLELPDPALDPASAQSRRNESLPTLERPSDNGDILPADNQEHLSSRPEQIRPLERRVTHSGHAYEVGQSASRPRSVFPRHTSSFLSKRTNSVPGAGRPPLLQRVLSISSGMPLPRQSSSLRQRNNDIALEAYREIDFRQAEFFFFLDKQLGKIEEFYKVKEDEATARLAVLREQLHMLRNRRHEDIVSAEQKRRHARSSAVNGALSFAQDNLVLPNWNTEHHGNHQDTDAPNAEGGTADPALETSHHHRWASVTSQVDNALDKVRTGHVGKTSKAMEELGTPSNPRLDPDHRDYVRRNPKETIPPYRTAKRKLKFALQEYYRGLELLKSYALLNRTAFRKINKKFDKTVDAPSGGTMRYMSDKVNIAHFVNSDIIDGHIQAIEDLYARYFERGNRKVAIGKLRGKAIQVGDYTGSLCRFGFFLGSGIVLGIQGLVYGCLDLFVSDPVFRTASSYLLQIYAGYFLFLLLVAFFCIDARIFSRAKVNYQFVFEFDSRHTLDWRQLSEIPSVFVFLLGLTMYLNFTVRVGGHDMYIYWPVVLVGTSAILLLLPPPLFYWKARKWFLYSLWRLLFAGVYPVEFRDFFLGDMFCSQTYAMGNIELFFCLYATHWTNPPTCNSSHSRLLGFFSTLPGVWRALQCIRRYVDTRNWYPHLANCLKYMCTILMYMSLSLFRIHKNVHFKAFFIVAATVNSVYCSFWDIFNDWSLGNPSAKHPLLRDTLAFKRQRWAYYAAMILDPILRFNWVFYAIFADDVQHSSIISFAVATSEVCRRGIWTIFRVENEHCTNVARNRVVRDVELPYQRASDETLSVGHFDGAHTHGDEEEAAGDTGRTTATDQQAPESSPSASGLRQRKQLALPVDSPVAQALKRVGSTVAKAHSQDYERKRRPMQGLQDADEESEDDEEENDDETAAAEDIANRMR